MNDLSILILSNGNAVQVAQRRIAGAEIVERHDMPRLLSRSMKAWFSSARSSSTVSVISISSRAGVRPEFFSAERMTSNSSACLNWTGDTLTATFISAGQRIASAQARRITHSPSGMISPVSSARGMNRSGGIKPTGRVVPAHQRFHAAPLPGLDVEERLVMHLELASCDGIAQVAFEGVAGFELGRHRLVIDRVAIPACRFRPIEREIRLLQQLVLLAAVLGRQCDPDTGADFDAVARQQERFGNEFRNSSREVERTAALILARGLDDGEFVATEPRQHVGCAQRGSQATGDLPEQFIAGGMTKRVVDVLETVEVEHEDRKSPLVPPLVRIDVMQLFQKERPVRKPGQDVGLRQFQNTPVRPGKLARIAACQPQIGRQERGDDDARGEYCQRAIIVRDQRTASGGRRPHLPVGVADPESPGPMRLRRERRHRTRLPLLGRKIGNARRLPGAAGIGRIDVDADGRTCRRRRSDRVQQRLEVEYGDDEIRPRCAAGRRLWSVKCPWRRSER